jgi:hypothetical protein
MRPVTNGAETIRIGRGWRVIMTVYGTGLSLVGLLGAGFLISAGIHLFGLVVIAFVGAMALACFRAARCRMEIHPDELVVANQLTTTVMRRGDLMAVEVGRSLNPFGARTIVLRSSSGRMVRVEAAARLGQTDTQLSPLVEKLTAWANDQ